MLRDLWGWLVRVGGVLAVLLALVWVSRMWGLTLGPVHEVRRARAELGPATLRVVNARLGGVSDVEDAQRLALIVTADKLHYGLAHETSWRFDGPREAHCGEYADMFGGVFNYIAKARGLKARAFAARSEAKVWTFRLPSAAWREHDYSVIELPDGSLRPVDPTFHDYFLGADLTDNVRGVLPLPRL